MNEKKYTHLFEKNDEIFLLRVGEREMREGYIFTKKMKK
jgi:hypothetical protein